MSFAPCSQPLALRLTRVHPLTGERITEGVVRRCGTRLLEACPGCADVYRRDAMRVLFEGLAANPGPRTWITLTAPGDAVFGRTHTAAYTRKASQRCACRRFHSPNDPRVGEPLDPATYRYDLVADFNRASARLLSNTMQKLRRLMCSEEPLPYARVVEYQRRGLVHVHVLVAAAIPRSVVELAVRGGVNLATRRPILPTEHGVWRWGPQLDVQSLADGEGQRGKLIGYMTKVVSYAIKDLAASAGVAGGASAHQRALARAGEASASCPWSQMTCRAGWQSTVVDGLRIEVGGRTERRCRRHITARRQWGFTGNVLSVSRSFGSSLTAVRERRRAYRAAQDPERALWQVTQVQWLGRAPRPAQTAEGGALLRPAPAGRLDPVKQLITLQLRARGGDLLHRFAQALGGAPVGLGGALRRLRHALGDGLRWTWEDWWRPQPPSSQRREPAPRSRD